MGGFIGAGVGLVGDVPCFDVSEFVDEDVEVDGFGGVKVIVVGEGSFGLLGGQGLVEGVLCLV